IPAMSTKIDTALRLGLSLLLWGSLAGALAAQQKPEEIPDAPSSTRPIPPPTPRQEAEEQSKPDSQPADGSGVTTGSKELPRSAPDSTDQKPAPPPMPEVKTVPAGSVPKDLETGQDLYKIRVTTNLVLVPVTVTDREGH